MGGIPFILIVYVPFFLAAKELLLISDDFFKLRNHNPDYKAAMKDIKDEIKKYRSLSNPRTVAYLAQIYDMTGGQLNQDLGLKSLFDFDVPACHEIGLGKRGLGYLKKYTPGLKGNLEEFNPISQWYQENVEDPFHKWVDRSKSNLSRTWNTSFNEDQMLRLLGKTCELRVVYKDFLKKLSPSELPASHCDFLIEFMPALKISAWKALSLIDRAIIPDTKGLKLIPVIIGKP